MKEVIKMKKYFENVNNLEELKSEYRKLALKYHPDRGGDVEEFKKISLEYEKLLKEFKGNEEFKKIIDELIKYTSITIELIGSWVWVYGDTKEIKEELKKLNFKWSGKRQMWYFTENKKKRNKYSKCDTDTLRSKYGSKILNNNSAMCLN